MPSIMCKHFFPEILLHLNKVNEVPWMFPSTFIFFPFFFMVSTASIFKNTWTEKIHPPWPEICKKKGLGLELNLYLPPILLSVHPSKWMSVCKQNCKMKWLLKSRKTSCLVFTQDQKAKSKFALEEKNGKERDTGRDSSSWAQVFFLSFNFVWSGVWLSALLTLQKAKAPVGLRWNPCKQQQISCCSNTDPVKAQLLRKISNILYLYKYPIYLECAHLQTSRGTTAMVLAEWFLIWHWRGDLQSKITVKMAQGQ